RVERFVRTDAERADDAVRAPRDEPVERTHEPVEEVKRYRTEQRDPERALDREVLRRELADDDVQVRERDERDREREHVIEGLHRVAKPAEERTDERRDGGLADPADREGGERDAKLRRGDVRVELRADRARAFRHDAARLRQLVELRLPDTDERVLGRDEEPVQEDEEDGDEYGRKGRARIHSPIVSH